MLHDVTYRLVYAVIELILPIFMKKSPPCLKDKKRKSRSIRWHLSCKLDSIQFTSFTISPLSYTHWNGVW